MHALGHVPETFLSAERRMSPAGSMLAIMLGCEMKWTVEDRPNQKT